MQNHEEYQPKNRGTAWEICSSFDGNANIMFFWAVILYSLVERYQCFDGAYFLHSLRAEVTSQKTTIFKFGVNFATLCQTENHKKWEDNKRSQSYDCCIKVKCATTGLTLSVFFPIYTFQFIPQYNCVKQIWERTPGPEEDIWVTQTKQNIFFNWINQPDAPNSQVYYLSFKYRSTCFGHPRAEHQEPQQLQLQPLVYHPSLVIAVLLVVVVEYHRQQYWMAKHVKLCCTNTAQHHTHAVSCTVTLLSIPELYMSVSHAICPAARMAEGKKWTHTMTFKNSST